MHRDRKRLAKKWTGLFYIYVILQMFVLAALFSGCVTRECRTRTPLPREKDLLGEWIGFTEDNLYFIRLRLGPQGTGLCARIFMSEQPTVLVVDHWRLDRRKLFVYATPLQGTIEVEQWPMSLIGDASAGSAIYLRASTTDGGHTSWTRNVILMRERRVIKALSAAQNAMRVELVGALGDGGASSETASRNDDERAIQ